MTSTTWEREPWLDAEHLQGVCDGALTRAGEIREQLAAAGAGGAGEALTRFNELAMAIDTASGIAALMFQVHPDAGIRDAARSCQQRISKLQTEVYLDRGLYDALAAVDPSGADAQTQRVHRKLTEEFTRAGVDRDDATRARLTALQAEMVELGQQFQQRVREDVRAVTVPPSALAGLPADFVEAHPPGEDGQVTITTDYPDFIPFQTYSPDADARRALYLAFASRAYPDNEPTLKALLDRRREYAGLLGYETWADYFAADKMVKRAARIESFLEEVVEAARPAAARDAEVLLELKRRDDPDASAIELWDRFYYVAKARDERYAYDARAVRPYFPYEQVEQGILDLYGELFGLSFRRLSDEPVWHPSVKAFALWADGREIGRFFLDMHPREGKFKHAAMFPVQTGLNTGRPPIAALVCNFPAPAAAGGQGHGLMEHTDVVTYFHEFGHLVHHLLASGTPWMRLSGLNVEWDFVETPSQLLEEWAWQPEVLARFARHVDTGERIPAPLVERMRAADELGKGLHIMRQLYYTAFSFFLHVVDPEALEFDSFSAEIAARYSPFPIPEEARLYASFGHLVGYTSAYYTYQWSLVMAKDLLTRFHAEGLLEPSVARAYRRHVLEPGATQDAADLVEAFLGRPYSTDAYRRWLTQPPPPPADSAPARH